jgi:dnd system-associated protein 4
MVEFIEYRKSDLFEKVVDKYEVFDSNYEFMIFLAVLGYREDNQMRDFPTGDGADSGQKGLDSILSNDMYRILMACLAFEDTGDPAALADIDTQVTTLTKYAAGGLEIAEEEFGDIAGDPTDAIINYIKQSREEDPTPEGELGKIVSDFDDDMLEGSTD